jgi:hypothetical protein
MAIPNQTMNPLMGNYTKFANAGATGTPNPGKAVVRPVKPTTPFRGGPVAMGAGQPTNYVEMAAQNQRTNMGPGSGGAQGGQQQQQIKPGQVQGQQQINPQMLMLLQMMQQRQQPQPMQQPQTQQPTKPAPIVGANWNPQYGAQMAAGAQYAQNNAMQNAVAQGNQARVSGQLQSASSGVQGNDLQNPGLYQASMAGQGGGENMNRYFGSHNERAYSLGFSGMDDPRYTQWVQQNGVNGNAAIGPGNNGGGGGSGGSGATGGASGGTAGGAGATNPTQDLLGNLFNNYQSQMDAANAANEARYGQGLEELQSLRSRSQNDINRLGSQQAQDIRKDANRTNAAALQNATARGLGNSTMPAIMQRGVQRDKTDALNRLGDSVAGQRLNADNQLTGNITNWIYNKNDNAPDFGQLIDLAKLYGESGYGQPQQQQGVPQLPPLDLSGLQGLLNGLGGIGQQLPQLMTGAQGQQQQQPQQQWQDFQMFGPGPGAGGFAGQQGQQGAVGAPGQGPQNPVMGQGSNGNQYQGSMGGMWHPPYMDAQNPAPVSPYYPQIVQPGDPSGSLYWEDLLNKSLMGLYL